MRKIIRSAVLCVCCAVLIAALLPLAGGFDNPAYYTVRKYAEEIHDTAKGYADTVSVHAGEFLHTMKSIASIAVMQAQQEAAVRQDGSERHGGADVLGEYTAAAGNQNPQAEADGTSTAGGQAMTNGEAEHTPQGGADVLGEYTAAADNQDPAADTAATSAAEQITAEFLLKDINIDGTGYDNYFLEKPVLQAHGEYYFPATPQMLKALGVHYLISDAAVEQFKVGDVLRQPLLVSYREVKKLEKCMPSYESLLCEFVRSDGEAFEQSKTLITNLRAYETFTEVEDAMFVKCPTFDVPDMRNGWQRYLETVEPAGCDFIKAGGLYKTKQGEAYFSSELLVNLGIDVFFDEISGLYISTRDGVSAKSLLNTKLQQQIDAYSDYILKFNKKISKEDAIRFEYYFRHEANVTGLNEAVIMAVARTESNFREEAVGSGSLGMMQTITKFAKNYGYSEIMLKNAHYSIELGAKYLMDRIHMFGTEEKMLVAYNRGPASVRAGRTSSPYSEKVLKIKAEIEACIEAN